MVEKIDFRKKENRINYKIFTFFFGLNHFYDDLKEYFETDNKKEKYFRYFKLSERKDIKKSGFICVFMINDLIKFFSDAPNLKMVIRKNRFIPSEYTNAKTINQNSLILFRTNEYLDRLDKRGYEFESEEIRTFVEILRNSGFIKEHIHTYTKGKFTKNKLYTYAKNQVEINAKKGDDMNNFFEILRKELRNIRGIQVLRKRKK